MSEATRLLKKSEINPALAAMLLQAQLEKHGTIALASDRPRVPGDVVQCSTGFPEVDEHIGKLVIVGVCTETVLRERVAEMGVEYNDAWPCMEYFHLAVAE